MTPSEQPRAAAVRQAAIILILVMASQAIFLIPNFREHLQEYLRITVAQFGLILSAISVAGVFVVLPSGILINRQGPDRVFRWCLAGVALSFLGLAVSGRSAVMVGVAVIVYSAFRRPMGVAVGLCLVRLFPHARRRALSVATVSSSGADFVFPILAEGLLSVKSRVRGIGFGHIFHLSYAVFSLLFAVVALLFRPHTGEPGEDEGRMRWHWREFLFPRRSMALLLLAVTHGSFDGALFLWYPRFLSSEAFSGAMPIPPGVFMSAFSAAYLISRLLLAGLPEHLWRRRLMILPGLTGGVVLVASLLSRNYLVAGFGYVVAGACWSAEFPVFMGRLSEETGGRFSAAMALQQVLVSLFGALIMTGIGYGFDLVGEPAAWKVMLIPAAVFPAIAAGAGWWIVRYDRRKPQET